MAAAKKPDKELTKSDFLKEIKKLGYHDIKEMSATRFAILVATNSTRESSLKSILSRLKTKYDVRYDKSTSLSSIGHLVIEGKYLLTAKPKSRQGTASAGVENEIMLVQEINDAIKDSDGDSITVIFKHGSETFKLNKVSSAVRAGSDTAGRKKSDVNITSSGKSIPISIKKDNAENWESADSYWGSTARQFIDYAVENKKAKLIKEGQVYKLEPNLAVKASKQEKESVVFGSDILEGNGAVIKKTFSKDDFKYDTKKNILTVNVSEIMRTIEDVTGPSDVWFLIRNDKTRLGSQIGYPGLRVLAVYQSRVNQNVVKLPRSVI